jgi:hypothetical protein
LGASTTCPAHLRLPKFARQTRQRSSWADQFYRRQREKGKSHHDRYTRVTAPAGFDGHTTRRDYYFKTKNAAREFRLRIKRWKSRTKITD